MSIYFVSGLVYRGRFKGVGHPMCAPLFFCRDRASYCVWVPMCHCFSSWKVFAPPHWKFLDLPLVYVYFLPRWGGALAFDVGYHPRKKIHVIRVVFQDQAMYARASFRGAKMYKIGKKGVFLIIVTNFAKDMMDKLRKTHAKTCILGLFSYLKNMCLGCILKVLLRGWYPNWNTSGPRVFFTQGWYPPQNILHGQKQCPPQKKLQTIWCYIKM